MRPFTIVLLLTIAATFALSGCSSTDTKNASARPWSSPRSWEHGLPTGITEGR